MPTIKWGYNPTNPNSTANNAVRDILIQNGPFQSSRTGNITQNMGLRIYKGTPLDLTANTTYSSRNDDLLINFQSVGGISSSSATITTVNGVLVYRFLLGGTTSTRNATASGTASWFLLNSQSATHTANSGAIVGTVGITGSGADMEIANTSIVAGNSYVGQGIYINFPLVWNV